MKKIKHLIIAIILILILFPTYVQAATDADIEDAVDKFTRAFGEGTNFYNIEIKSNNDNISNLMYEGNYEYGNKIAFTNVSFVDYVYNRVFGIDMKNDNGSFRSSVDNFVDTGIFSKDEATNNKKLTKELIDKYLKAGDPVWNNGKLMIYIGDYNFAMFDDSTHQVHIITKDAITGNVTSLKLNHEKCDVKTDSPGDVGGTTVDHEFDKLGITAELVATKPGQWGIKLNRSQSEIVKAISRGYRSETGDPNPFSKILIFFVENKMYCTLNYQYANGMYKSISTSELVVDSFNDENNTKNVMNNGMEYTISLEEYKSNNNISEGGMGSEYLLYFNSNDRSLYAGFEWEYNGKKFSRYIPITNGEEINGEIEAFTDGIIADANLSEFVGETLVVPESATKMVYNLNFSSSKSATINKNSDGGYNCNKHGEILFTVNKSGNYTITSGKDTYILGIHTAKLDLLDISNIEYTSCGVGPLADSHPMRRAGEVIEGEYTEKGEPVGRHIEPKDSDGMSMAFPLKEGEIYVIRINDFFTNKTIDDFDIFEIDLKKPLQSNELVEIFDKNLSSCAYLESQEDKNVIVAVIEPPKPETIFEKLEHLLSFCVRGIGNGIVYMINLTLGAVAGEEQDVTLDTIIFNQYKPVQLAFFTKGSMEPGVFVSDFSENIEKCYNMFLEIAIVGYLIVLLYMGIRIVLNSTAGKKAMYKELFVQWVTGIIILFTFPVVIRYAIEINNAIVEVAKSSVDGSLNSGSAKEAKITPDESSTVADGDIKNEEAVAMDQNPFEANDQGYMAVMARRAHDSKKLVYAFVYLIMAFQLLIIAIMYYKRLFMVAFLIVLFPLVMLMFVLEKIGNIRTGAFNKWTKEIMVTIFIQSIHAVIYAFTMTAVANAGSSDWFLILVGVTFLFNGEEILKKILGQQSEATPSLAQTATTTAAAFMAVKGGTQRLADNVIGAGSHLGRTISNARQAKKDKLIAENMDAVGTPPPRLSDGAIGNYKNLRNYNKELELAQAQGPDEVANLNEMAEAVYILNHRYDASPEQIAKALKVVNDNRKKGKFLGMMEDLDIKENTLVAIERAKGNAINKAISGKTIQEIDADLTAELERILPNEGANVLAAAIYEQIGKVDLNARRNAVGGGTTFNGQLNDDRKLGIDDIKKEISDARERKNTIKDSIKISKARSKVNDGLEENAVKMLERIYGTNKKVSRDKMRMALSVSMLKDASSGKYDAKELMASANYILANKENSKEFKKMAKELGYDINEFRHILAEKVCEEEYDTTDFRKKKRKGEKLKLKVSPQAVSETDEEFEERVTREESACSLAEKALKDYEDFEIGYETSLGVDGNKNGYNLDKIDVSRVMALDAATNSTSAEFKERRENELAEKIRRDRQKRNTDEQNLLFDFAAQGKEMHKEVYEKTYQGLTKEEWMKKKEYDASKSRKEALRTALTVTASVEGGILGSAAAIGIGENGGVVQEAAAGFFGGAVTGDAIAEEVTSDGVVKKKIKKINPYTGEEVEVEITTWGGFSDGELESTTSDVGAKLSKKLDEQFLMQKVERDRKFAEARKKKSEDTATREKLTEAYRKAMEDAQNAGENNSENNNT